MKPILSTIMPIMTPEEKSLKAIRKVLETTPPETIEKIIAEVKALNINGPSVQEYFEMVGFNMTEHLFEALSNKLWQNHNIYDFYTMDGKPELWKIAYYPMFEDSKTGKPFDEPRALIERPAIFDGIIGTDFREMPLRYLTKKIAFPNSEHHNSDYRIDLGYFRTSNGNEYQLGMTDLSYREIWSYDCDYTITGEENADYSSGRLDVVSIFKINPGKFSKNGDYPKHQLFKRAVSKGLIDINKIRPLWISEEGIGLDEYPGNEYPTFDNFKNWLSGK